MVNKDYVLPTLNEDLKTLASLIKTDLVNRHLASNFSNNSPEAVAYRNIQGVLDNCQTRIDNIKLGVCQGEEINDTN